MRKNSVPSGCVFLQSANYMHSRQLQCGQILSSGVFTRYFCKDRSLDVSSKRSESLRNTLFLQSANYMHSRQSQCGQILFKIARSTIFYFPIHNYVFTKYFCKLEVTIIICRKIDVSPERNTLF